MIPALARALALVAMKPKRTEPGEIRCRMSETDGRLYCGSLSAVLAVFLSCILSLLQTVLRATYRCNKP